MSSTQRLKFASVKPATIEWRDHLPYSPEFGDIYFSIDGALAESQHVFIDGCELAADWLKPQQQRFTLLELGFGSGLNFLNTASLWQQLMAKPEQGTKHLHYLAIEKRPFAPPDLQRCCTLWPQFSALSAHLLRDYPSCTYGRHQLHFDAWNLTLTLLFMPADEALSDLLQESHAQDHKIAFDHWFLDGFAPSKNGAMWHSTLVQQMAALSKPGARVATYTVAGAVKRALTDAGFEIAKRPGFGRKREMLSAQFRQAVPAHHAQFINSKLERPWFKHRLSVSSDRVAIIGGGIAGCASAFCLAQKGVHVDLYEARSHLAQGASGAAAGIFYPRLTPDINHNSQFNWLAYLYLLRFLSTLTKQEQEQVVLSRGVHHLCASPRHKTRLLDLSQQLSLTDWISDLPHLNGVSYPHAAALNLAQFCQLLLDKIPSDRLTLQRNCGVEKLSFDDPYWVVHSHHQSARYRHIVYCGGARSPLLEQFVCAPTHSTRGQTCFISSAALAAQVDTTLCEQLYLVPRGQGEFHLGATFDDFTDDQLNANSQHQMLNEASDWLARLNLPFLSSEQLDSLPLRGSVGYRLHTLDRFPLIGGVSDTDKLARDFAGLGHSRIKREAISDYNIPGLWVNTAYGSHGLLYSLLGSQHLVSLITNEISPLDCQLAHALHPSRFFIKQLKAGGTASKINDEPIFGPTRAIVNREKPTSTRRKT